MPQTVISQDHDTLDQIVARTIGIVNESLLEEAHDLNPKINNYGPTLPYGISVKVPDRPADASETKRTVKLYD